MTGKPMIRSFQPAKPRFRALSVSTVTFWLTAFLISTIGAVAAEPSDPVGEAEAAVPESDRVKEFFTGSGAIRPSTRTPMILS